MSEQLAKRTKSFAVRVLRLADALPHTASGKAMASQIARSGTSVAANFRAAMRGRSKAEFISKLHIACEEADETQFWIELIEEYGALPGDKLHDLHQESSEITAILTSSIKTAKANLKKNAAKP